VTITGRPRRSTERQFGYPYEIPISRVPTAEWAARFADIDWQELTGLRRGHHPRLHNDTILLPRVAPMAWERVLDSVRRVVGLVNRQVAEAAVAGPCERQAS
jgi:hypothetical protein